MKEFYARSKDELQNAKNIEPENMTADGSDGKLESRRRILARIGDQSYFSVRGTFERR